VSYEKLGQQSNLVEHKLQPNEVSNWFVLTLSAERAAMDEDFEHLDVLLRRREEILTQWEQEQVKFTAKQQEEIKVAENRLLAEMIKLRDRAGANLQAGSKRTKVAAAYRASA